MAHTGGRIKSGVSSSKKYSGSGRGRVSTGSSGGRVKYSGSGRGRTSSSGSTKYRGTGGTSSRKYRGSGWIPKNSPMANAAPPGLPPAPQGGLRAAAFGGGGSGGGGGGSRGYGGGGGGDDGGQAAYNDFLAKLAALRQQAEQRLVSERDRRFGDIGQLRHDSIRAIDTDASNTVNSVRGVYRDADRQGRQYDAQLAGLGRDIAGGLSAYANPIAADLAAQGIRVTPGGLTAADAQYARALAAAQGTLSGRFNQVNAGAGADSVAGVLQTRQAGRGTAMNEAAAARNQVNNEYLQQLLALQQMGLSGST